jgi:hypothetical protein
LGNFDQRIEQLKHQTTAPEDEPPPVVLVAVEGNPDVRPERPMISEREAQIGDEYFAATADETTQQFHARLKAHYRQTNARGCVVLGHPGNAVPSAVSRFNADGSPITIN